jgi:RecJ-like exonuclease
MAECNDCDGPDLGAALVMDFRGNGKCSHCHGTGKSQDLVDNFVDEIMDNETDCHECSGTGQCQECGGTGKVVDDDEEEDSEEEEEENRSSSDSYESYTSGGDSYESQDDDDEDEDEEEGDEVDDEEEDEEEEERPSKIPTIAFLYLLWRFLR